MAKQWPLDWGGPSNGAIHHQRCHKTSGALCAATQEIVCHRPEGARSSLHRNPRRRPGRRWSQRSSISDPAEHVPSRSAGCIMAGGWRVMSSAKAIRRKDNTGANGCSSYCLAFLFTVGCFGVFWRGRFWGGEVTQIVMIRPKNRCARSIN